MFVRPFALVLVLVLIAGISPARAARPLLDSHQWDAYFALFARDAMVPWKKITLRLDTYSGAPVDFAAYAVDPAEVIVAGGNSRPRSLDTSHLTPAAKWRFTPPPGYQFVSNDVEVPLANREGFYVIEARRGDAVQQVWINITRIGLVVKSSPGGLLVYGADLGSGHALRGMRVFFLAGSSLQAINTDADGIARWDRASRPRFALAEWGNSKAFVSLLAQSPLPQSLVGVRVERSIVHAGDVVHVAGFARRLSGGTYRPASGDVRVTIAGRGRTVTTQSFDLDRSGAFAGNVAIPAGTEAGDFAVLATSAGGTGGSLVHIDAVGDVALSVAAACGNACSATEPVPLVVTAKRGAGGPAADTAVAVRIVRTPHIVPPGESDDLPRWETALVLNQTVRTDANGIARIAIPAPSDGLASTYGVTASTNSTTASTRIATPTARVALAIEPSQPLIDPGQSAAFAVRGFDAADGRPAAGLSVNVSLQHGASTQQQTIVLDAQGTATASFHDPALGTNLAIARADVDGKIALDANSVTVAPNALGSTAAADTNNAIAIALDHTRYKLGDRIGINATLGGASGDALVTLEGARVYDAHAVGAGGGRASTGVTLHDVLGDVRIGVAMVRDGALYTASVPLAIDAPGHPRLTKLSADKSAYGPGSTATVTVDDGGLRDGSTVIVRVTDGRVSPGASFEDASALLATGGTTTQNTLSSDPNWHAWVAPSRSRVIDVFAYEQPQIGAREVPALGAAAPRAYYWKVDREESGPTVLPIPMPMERGRYVVSVMKISDDGDVGAASLAVSVQ